MEECVQCLDLTKIKELYASLEADSLEKDRFRASLEKALVSRALLIAPTSEIDKVNSFLQFVISLAYENFCITSLPVQILQDMFDVCLIKRCEEIFTIFEKNIIVFKTDFFFIVCKNLILRMCNDLLKRLSRTVNTAFCGKIIVLLARFLPLNERSGLNLPGHFNTDNITFYEQNEDKINGNQTHDDDEERDEGEVCDSKERNIAVNYALYVKFWEIQAIFSNPNLLVDSTKFTKFENDLWDVLSIFSIYKLERPQSSKTLVDEKTVSLSPFNQSNGVKDNHQNEELPTNINNKKELNNSIFKNLDVEDHFFTKYLTSQKLFNLQLADSQFRRYFLVQCLILINYLSVKIKAKDNNFLVMRESFLKEFGDKCYLLLKETYPHGSHFAESVRRILNREKLWANWKSEGCPDLIEPLLKKTCRLFKKRPIDRYNLSVIDLGNKELTRLWNIGFNNIEACSDKKRKCVPNLKQFIDDGLDEMDPDQKVEEQYKSINNENYQWMANRFLLYHSDQYMNCANIDLKAPPQPIAKCLEKAIYLTALSIPELNEKAERIQEKIKQIEIKKASEEARIVEEQILKLKEKQEIVQKDVVNETKKVEPENKLLIEKEKAVSEDKVKKCDGKLKLKREFPSISQREKSPIAEKTLKIEDNQVVDKTKNVRQKNVDQKLVEIKNNEQKNGDKKLSTKERRVKNETKERQIETPKRQNDAKERQIEVKDRLSDTTPKRQNDVKERQNEVNVKRQNDIKDRRETKERVKVEELKERKNETKERYSKREKKVS